jgi:hypothetical protein
MVPCNLFSAIPFWQFVRKSVSQAYKRESGTTARDFCELIQIRQQPTMAFLTEYVIEIAHG